ncbi:MAG: UDP-glucose 4-epimerase GalE [Burkholderiaceae bacterium]|jgi:UDP-glucose 4-epimerase|nr:UDP-glucose 4-epimerase GalE [Burkholderiaceae bacterium]
MKPFILVTGGTGYIGSHTVIQLQQKEYPVVILDNLSNSSPVVLDRIASITGNRPAFVEGDIRDRDLVRQLFRDYAVSDVIHFAGLKAVGEGEAEPLRYYDNNVSGSLALFQEMEAAGVFSIIFSSSATVYGNPGYSRFTEETPLNPVNVYGDTKKMVEDILRAAKRAQPVWQVALLRYFNPVGAHVSGMIGEDPAGIPNNLMPFITQVAVGKREKLSVFGNDWPTPDGTGRRDYIHVEDLASAHLAALNKLQGGESFLTVNVGTGRPYSVLEMVAAFEKASGKTIPYQFAARRAGDIAECYADPALAKTLLGWQAQHDVNRMCADSWRWQKNNPVGYE